MNVAPTILVLCPYPEGVAAGQRLKYEQYLGDWRAHGYRVKVSPFMDMALWEVAYVPGHHLAKTMGVVKGYLRRLRDLARVPGAEIVYVHMWVTPFGSTFFERLVRRLTRRLVYDVEDNIIAPPPVAENHPNPLLRWIKGTGKPRYLIRKADEVIVASDYLAPAYAKINRNDRCELIPPSLDTDRFVPADRPASERNGGLVTIGWTGTFSSKPYLDMVAPMLVELARSENFRFRVIGNFDYALSGVDLEVVQWARDDEVAQLQGIDIGIYPLPDDEWAKGKAGLKIIQYQAVGLPCVASHAGISPMQIEEGITGCLVRDEAEWIGALKNLIHHPDLRRRMGLAARTEAVRRYSREAVAARYRTILARAASSASRAAAPLAEGQRTPIARGQPDRKR
ncbi:MAG: glycosyltransferase family 4 protein [Tsuneonella sp.]